MSDLHGYLPAPVKANLAIVAGDICPHGNSLSQFVWLASKFQPWLQSWECPVLYIAGNHDTVFATWPGGMFPGLIGGTYLENQLINNDLTVYGCPHSLRTDRCIGAFTTTESAIERSLPPQADILIIHTPPWCVGDRTYEGMHPGSIALREWIEQTSPRVVICGHIHENRGVYLLGNTIVVNAALNTLAMRPENPIILLDA